MQLFPWFQPIVEIASGQVVGFEALARCYGAEGEVVSGAPVLFSDALSADQRLELDRSLRRLALQRFAEEASPDQYLTLNLSPEWIDALNPDDPLPTLEMIYSLGLDPARIVVEITELNGDVDLICQLAQRYRDAGVRVAFDDFGAGFQQLDRLLAFTPDIIKLDIRMFSDSQWSHRKGAMMQLVGDLGARVGAQVVCEGVETAEEFMLALHCNASSIQGYIFSPAVEYLMAPEAQRESIELLLGRHLDMAVNEVTQRQWHTEKLHTGLLGLRDQLCAAGVDRALSEFCPDPDLLRLYICDRSGHQISANYYWHGGHWLTDETVIGNNWSWRPWFYQLISSPDYQRAVLCSEHYVDLDTGKRCYTVSLALDDERVLLVDMQEPEDKGVLSLLGNCHSGLMPGGNR